MNRENQRRAAGPHLKNTGVNSKNSPRVVVADHHGCDAGALGERCNDVADVRLRGCAVRGRRYSDGSAGAAGLALSGPWLKCFELATFVYRQRLHPRY